jgi:hypothetical protein
MSLVTSKREARMLYFTENWHQNTNAYVTPPPPQKKKAFLSTHNIHVNQLQNLQDQFLGVLASSLFSDAHCD